MYSFYTWSAASVFVASSKKHLSAIYTECVDARQPPLTDVSGYANIKASRCQL